jgi:hypothetical protein
MELNKDNYVSLISNLSQLQRVSFYERLAHNITIAIRAIWSDETMTDTAKIQTMKWLNEIQHRVVTKISVERLVLHEWKESDMIRMIEECTKECPSIGSEITWAIKASYKTTINNIAK